MAIRNIVLEGDPILRKKSKPVLEFDDKLAELLDDMKQTMQKNDGAGLAAVQVGILRRIFVIEVNGMYVECINPLIVKSSGEQCQMEGCLSIVGRSGYVIRPYKVTIKAFDRKGYPFSLTLEDYSAVAICHEYDHLDGILYIDKLTDKPNDKK